MSYLVKHRLPFTFIIASLLLIAGLAAVFWARGFKPDIRTGTIKRTGLIVATSIPTGAQVFLDDRLTSATDTNIAFLEPKTYKVKITKEGYTTWEKDVEIQADLATEIKALLFPTAPEIKPLTATGAANPALSPDGSKIVYGVAGPTGGLYGLPMSDRPFPFRQSARLLAKNQLGFDFSQATLLWDPNSKQLIAQIKNPQTGQDIANILIDSERSDQQLLDITASLGATIAAWQQEYIQKAQTAALVVPENIKSATAEAKLEQQNPESTTSRPQPKTSQSLAETINYQPSTINLLNYFPTGLVFSPDEEKVLYKNKESKYKVYDLKNKKGYTLPDFKDFVTISWYPDSNHLVVAQKDLISIIEADGTNKLSVYRGKFENACPPEANASGDCGRGFVFSHPSGSRLIILTTLTQSEGTPANLYSINLR